MTKTRHKHAYKLRPGDLVFNYLFRVELIVAINYCDHLTFFTCFSDGRVTYFNTLRSSEVLFDVP